jgi:hypothetical protein
MHNFFITRLISGFFCNLCIPGALVKCRKKCRKHQKQNLTKIPKCIISQFGLHIGSVRKPSSYTYCSRCTRLLCVYSFSNYTTGI